MNILMLGRWLPPPRHPLAKMREYQFARCLAREHRLTLAFITDNPNASGPISALRGEFGDLEFSVVPRGWKSLASAVRLATGESCTLSYYRSEALRTRLADRLRTMRYDLVFVTSSGMIQYALEVDAAIPLIMDFADVDSEWWAQQARRGAFPGPRVLRTEAMRLRAAEAAAAKRAARCLVTLPATGELVKSFAPDAPITIIPNGVDVDSFAPAPRRAPTLTVALNANLAVEAEAHDVIEFRRSVMPIIRARFPEARFIVVSKEASGTGRPATDLTGMDVVAPRPDVRSVLRCATIAVAPLRAAANVIGAVLEPMAAGLPVVATSEAAGRLGAAAGRDLLVAEGLEDFALKVIQLLEDPALRAEVGARGRTFVSAQHAWSVMTARLSEVVRAVVKPASAASSSEPEPLVELRP
jgi:glycosyltransferase involved in cell wall biosynthesis